MCILLLDNYAAVLDYSLKNSILLGFIACIFSLAPTCCYWTQTLASLWPAKRELNWTF